MRTLRALSALLLLAAAGCASQEEQLEVDRESIAAALEQYLPVLGQAYSTGELEPLNAMAAQKEVAAIEKRISDLADQGRILEPTFRELTVEEVKVFNYANAYVTTFEVWDIRSLATGSRELLAEETQRTRVKYQLKRDGDSWRVLYRARQG